MATKTKAKSKGKAKKASVLNVDKEEAVALFVACGYPTATDWTESKLEGKLAKFDTMVEGVTLKKKDKEMQPLMESILEAVENGDEVKIEAAAGGKKGKGKGKPAPAKKGRGKAKDEEEDEEDEDDEEDEEDEDDEEDEEDEDEDSDDDEEDEEDEDEDEDSDDEDDDDADDGDEDEDADDDDESDEDEDEDSDDEDEDEDDDVEDNATKKKGKKDGKAGKGGGKSPVGQKAKSKDGLGVIQTAVALMAAASSTKPISKVDIIKKIVKKFGKPESAVKATINTQVPNRLKTDKGLTIGKNDEGYWIDPKKNKKALKEMGIEV